MCASDKLQEYLQDTQWSFAETIVKSPVSNNLAKPLSYKSAGFISNICGHLSSPENWQNYPKG